MRRQRITSFRARFRFRAVSSGAHYAPGGPWSFRLGYCYNTKPIPDVNTAFNIASENSRHLEGFTVAAGLYVVITFAVSLSLALVGRWAFRVRAKIF